MKHRPADVNQLGKLITDIAVGDVEDEEPKSARVKGGHARAAAITPEQRREIATKAARTRWKKPKVAVDAAP